VGCSTVAAGAVGGLRGGIAAAASPAVTARRLRAGAVAAAAAAVVAITRGRAGARRIAATLAAATAAVVAVAGRCPRALVRLLGAGRATVIVAGVRGGVGVLGLGRLAGLRGFARLGAFGRLRRRGRLRGLGGLARLDLAGREGGARPTVRAVPAWAVRGER